MELLGLVAAIFLCADVEAAPVLVRFPEGVARGFLSVRSQDGSKLADGDLVQVARDGGIESRLTFRFKNGSVYDETVLFSQQRAFTLLRYRLVHRGPSFPTTLEVSFDRNTAQYRGRYREGKGGDEESLSGAIELPPDVYNGMTSLLLKNMSPGTGGTVQIVVFTPKPRLVRLHISPAGERLVPVGDTSRTATQYLVTPEIGGLMGFFASLTGKKLPVLNYWITREEVPAFLKFEGPFFMEGPIWRVGSSYRTDEVRKDPRVAQDPRKGRKKDERAVPR